MFEKMKNALLKRSVKVTGKTATDYWLKLLVKPKQDADTQTPALDAQILALESELSAASKLL
jgi:hypothetical protein